MIIRRFKDHEWRLYRDLRLRSLKESPTAFCATLASAQRLPHNSWRSRITEYDANKNYPILALSDDKACGLGWAALEDDHNANAHLFQLWVAPNYRGLGLGQQIIESAIIWARNVGAVDLTLGIIVGNSGAERLYQSLAFKKTGVPVPVEGREGLLTQDMVLKL